METSRQLRLRAEGRTRSPLPGRPRPRAARDGKLERGGSFHNPGHFPGLINRWVSGGRCPGCLVGNREKALRRILPCVALLPKG